jgi:type II secretory pathway pseudopilin PulG
MDALVEPTPMRRHAAPLVTLLVVVTVLGVLAAVGTAGLVTMLGSAPVDRCVAEVATVQDAMDTMMADQGIVAVAAQDSASDTFTGLPTGPGTLPLAPRYLPLAPTTGRYTWDAAGTVSQAGCP